MAHSNAASWDPAVTHFVSVSCVSNYANGVLSARLGSARLFFSIPFDSVIVARDQLRWQEQIEDGIVY